MFKDHLIRIAKAACASEGGKGISSFVGQMFSPFPGKTNAITYKLPSFRLLSMSFYCVTSCGMEYTFGSAVLAMSPPNLLCRRRERETHDASQAPFSSSQNSPAVSTGVAPRAVHITVWVAVREVNFTVSSQSDLGQILSFKGR